MPSSAQLIENTNPTQEASPQSSSFDLEKHDAVASSLPGAKEARKAMEMIMDSKTAWSKQHNKMDEANKFYIGDQWSEEDKEYLREQDRIPVVFNYVAKHIDTIVGSEIHNHQQTRFVPRNLDPNDLPKKSMLGELETSAYDWVMDLCEGEHEDSLAFKDLLVGGLAVVEIYVDREIEKDVRICVRRINPMEILYDARAQMQNLDDARWIARMKQIPLESAIEMFPDKEDELRAIEQYHEGIGLDQRPEKIEEYTPIMYEPGRITTSPGAIPGKKGLVIIIQYQHWVLEDMYRVKDPVTGKEEEYTEEEYERIKKRSKDVGHKLEAAKQTRRVYKEQFIAGNQLPLTEDEDLPVQAGGFTFKMMTGKWDVGEKVYRGAQYSMMDPGRYANKYLSQTIHIINSNPKGGVLAEADVFKDPTSVERDWARPNSIILVEKGALAEKRVEVKPVTHLPDSTFQMWQRCIEAITGVSGVNPEMLGQNQSDLPALTMRQRMVQGMQVNALYFAALTRFKKAQARTVLEYIREFISDGRMIRIGGQFNSQMLPLFKEKISAEYDIVLDEAIRSPNAKAEVFANLQPILPVVIRSGLMVPELLDIVPGLPASIASKMKEKMGEGPVGGKPGKGGQQGQGKQQDPMETQAKVQKLQADVQLAQAKIQEVMARARALDKQSQIKEMAAATDHRTKLQKSAMDMNVQHAKMQREAAQHQVKIQGDQAKMYRDATRLPRMGRIQTGEPGYDNSQP